MTPNLQLECFAELLTHTGIFHQLLYNKNCEPILVGFAFALMSVSGKYRLDEPYNDLMEVAAKELISDYKEELRDTLNKNYGYFSSNEPLIGKFVPELVAYIKSHGLFKNMVSGLLKMQRDAMFEESSYTVKLADMIHEEHPIITFVRAIDAIESKKGKPKSKDNLLRKRENWKYLRIGYSVLDKSDWKPRIEFLSTSKSI